MFSERRIVSGVFALFENDSIKIGDNKMPFPNVRHEQEFFQFILFRVLNWFYPRFTPGDFNLAIEDYNPRLFMKTMDRSNNPSRLVNLQQRNCFYVVRHVIAGKEASSV